VVRWKRSAPLRKAKNPIGRALWLAWLRLFDQLTPEMTRAPA
jgi:hypothetical protein